jgi:hypothetical protein
MTSRFDELVWELREGGEISVQIILLPRRLTTVHGSSAIEIEIAEIYILCNIRSIENREHVYNTS